MHFFRPTVVVLEKFDEDGRVTPARLIHLED